ncbi:MAG: tetratricopeptide repeat protein [Bacteroidetes bacterium]|nr:tetratricopeptide repeat protein [Bacteroidota bacterium]
MKRLWPVLLLMTIAVCGFGQNVDSLYHLWMEAKGDRRISLVNEIAQAAYKAECTDTLFRVTPNTEPVLMAAIVHELMASYADYVLSDLARAVRFALEAAKEYEEAGDLNAMDVNYSNAANAYFKMGDYEKAIELMLRCYELELRMDDAPAVSITLNDLGVVYSTWGKNEEAIAYFSRAEEIERPLNRPMQYAGRLSQLAKEYAVLGIYDEALRLISAALVYDEKIERNERDERIAVHRRIMGDIYEKMDSLPQAENCYQRAIPVFEQNNRQQPLAESLLSLGRLQLQQGRFAGAIETLHYCVAIAEKNHLLRTLRDANHFLYEVSKVTGNTAQALFYLEQYGHMNDSIFKETTQQQINEFQVKYETAEKEVKILRQQTEIERHKIRQFIYIGLLIAAGLLFVLLLFFLAQRTRRNRELADTNATKDKFFSIISHDLKNPAVMQRDALKLLVDHSREWEGASVAKYHQKLLQSANEQVELLYTLLGWAQVQTGRISYYPRLFDLTSLLQSGMELIHNMADAKGVALEVRMPASLLVTGDDNMLATVVRNLLVNAVKFTAKGGSVTLEVTPHKVSVSDTGTGISAEQLQNLFRLNRPSFHQGTAGETGVGLGLIVCKEFLEKHGTHLHVESAEGRGSRFWFALPDQL